jgi:hypothetical protein
MTASPSIRAAAREDDDAIWAILEPAFRAMQFNFVIAANERAVKLWRAYGLRIVGTLPAACEHPRLGPVDAYVMFRTSWRRPVTARRREQGSDRTG